MGRLGRVRSIGLELESMHVMIRAPDILLLDAACYLQLFIQRDRNEPCISDLDTISMSRFSL